MTLRRLGSFLRIYVFFGLFPDLSSVVSIRSCPVMGTLERDLVKMLDSTWDHLIYPFWENKCKCMVNLKDFPEYSSALRGLVHVGI